MYMQMYEIFHLFLNILLVLRVKDTPISWNNQKKNVKSL